MDPIDAFKRLLSADQRTNVQFSIDGDIINLKEHNGTDVYFKVGSNLIDLQSTSGNCIEVSIEKTINLDEYYYKASVLSCPILHHALFFKLLDVLSSVLKLDITLTDSSTKDIYRADSDPSDHDCKLPVTIMAMAKGKSFYNRFGFYNEKFEDLIAEGQKLPLYNLQPYLTDDEYDIIVPQDKYNTITMKEVSLKLLDLCKQKKVPDIVRKFIKKFHGELEDILFGLEFHKPYSKNEYTVHIEPNEHFVHVAFTTAPKGGRKRSRRSAKKTKRRAKFRSSF